MLDDLMPAEGRDRAPKSLAVRLIDIALGRIATLILAALALVLGIGSFAFFAGGIKLGLHAGAPVALALANFTVLLLLIMVLVGRVTRVVVERRRGAAGARLHVQLVFLFGGVAAVPAILVGVFAAAFFNLGIQAWFNQRVRTALAESSEVAQGYLAANKNNIRLDALSIANELARAGPIFFGNPQGFANFLVLQTSLDGLTQAVIFEPVTGEVVASAGILAGMDATLPSHSVIEDVEKGNVVILNSPNSTDQRAVVQIDSTPPLMLLIERPIDPSILAHVQRTQQAVAEYNRLEHNRARFEVFFALIFATVALLVLSAAALIGLVLANQIARPISHLIRAAERVRAGDLQVRVPETGTGDDIAGLSRAFNRMTGQLGAQRAELMNAYGQLDERRRFTETVLAGVSAGVIGLDARLRIELPNRTACELLGIDLVGEIGRDLRDVLPEFAPLLRAAEEQPERPAIGELEYGPVNARRIFLVRIGADLKAGLADGYVVTFDDITALQDAQRKAAWSDVARRIAHEIKNPLTPIQLAAERLKRRFAAEITSDPETFKQCADTIVRHVGDIGRMVDEFSHFARMPNPIMRDEDIGRIVRDSVFLQKTAHPDINWTIEVATPSPRAICDRALLGQALTNLLQNAADAIAMRQGAGQVNLSVVDDGVNIRISVSDDGIGLPVQDRGRLTEPYVTHKLKGTGLGLAIVRKIMEDHGGSIDIAERADAPGAIVTLTLPAEITLHA